jgi:putative ABC transport system permease protein
MFSNYLKIAWRNIYKYKLYSGINILGLSIGLSTFLIVVLFLKNEFSYEKFNTKMDHIYRLEHGEWSILGTVYADMVKTNFPEVERATRFDIWSAGGAVLKHDDHIQKIKNIVFADAAVFDIFTFPFIQGNAVQALETPLSIVLTHSTARRIFNDENPIGQEIKYNNQFFLKVTGVIDDVQNFHIPINAIVSFNTLNVIYNDANFLTQFDSWNYPTFLLLKPNADITTLENKINALFSKYKTFFWDEKGHQFHLRPLNNVYFSGETKYGYGIHGNMERIYIVISLAIVILLIACLNFINLTTARASLRAREVGVRKVLGAYRVRLIVQFLGESIMMCGCACVLAIILVLLLLPYFNRLFDMTLSFDSIDTMDMILFSIAGIVVLGMLAGIFPALHLTSFRAAVVLKKSKNKDMAAIRFRRVLIGIQFAISSMLIIGTLVISRQLNFLKSKNLGFDKSLILTIPVNKDIVSTWQSFKNRLLNHPEITNVSFSFFPLGEVGWIQSWDIEGEQMSSNLLFVDPEFIPMLDIQIIDGRNYSWNMETDKWTSYIINEEAARRLPPGPVVGRKLEKGTIIGVVSDFHFNSLRTKISPLVLAWGSDNMHYANIKISPLNVENTIRIIDSIWQEFSPEFPFEYSFLDKRIDSLYQSEQRLAHIFSTFSVMAIIIACVGLFGLSAFLIIFRSREIAVRKIFGASAWQILIMLSREFSIIIFIANLVIWPIIYLVANHLLQNFAYRIPVSWWYFMIALIVTLSFSFITTSWQAIRAANANPVESLRYE